MQNLFLNHYSNNGRNRSGRTAGIALAAIVASLLAAPGAYAQNTTYVDLDSFNAVVNGTTIVTFEGAASPGTTMSYSGGYVNSDATNGDATFYTNNQQIQNTGTVYTDGSVAYDASDVQHTSGQTSDFLVSNQYGVFSDINGINYNTAIFNGSIVFSSQQQAFGALYGRSAIDSGDLPWEADFYSGSTLIGSVNLTAGFNPDSPSFFGFTSTTGFDSVVFNGLSIDPSATGSLFLDDVRYGTSLGSAPAAVPEPGIVVTGLSMAGMTGLGLVRGRRRSRRETAA